MADPDFREFTLVAKGHQFEDFSVGQIFEHHWGRTLNAGDGSRCVLSSPGGVAHRASPI
jgi:hypothetical protein